MSLLRTNIDWNELLEDENNNNLPPAPAPAPAARLGSRAFGSVNPWTPSPAFLEERKKRVNALPKGAIIWESDAYNRNRHTRKARHYENIRKNVKAAKALPFSTNVQSHIASYLTGLNKMSVNQQGAELQKLINVHKNKSKTRRTRSRRY